jgi:hypothetical protein
MNFSALLFAGAARHQSLRLAHTAVLHRSCEKPFDEGTPFAFFAFFFFAFHIIC